MISKCSRVTGVAPQWLMSVPFELMVYLHRIEAGEMERTSARIAQKGAAAPVQLAAAGDYRPARISRNAIASDSAENRGLRGSPVFQRQSGNPREVSCVAGDKNSTRFQCRGCDDEVRITTRQSAATGDGP